jgi:hypothetical protein
VASDVLLLPNEGSYVEFLRLRKVPLVGVQLIAGDFALLGLLTVIISWCLWCSEFKNSHSQVRALL